MGGVSQGGSASGSEQGWLSKRVLVEMVPGVVPNLKAVAGVAAVSERGKYAVVTMQGAGDAAVLGAQRMNLLAGVKLAEPMLARQQQKRFIPNDPYFAYNASNPAINGICKTRGNSVAQRALMRTW